MRQKVGNREALGSEHDTFDNTANSPDSTTPAWLNRTIERADNPVTGKVVNPRLAAGLGDFIEQLSRIAYAAGMVLYNQP